MQDVLELTPDINLITLFCILNILLLMFKHKGRQRVLKFMVLRIVFGCKGEEWQEAGENEILMTFVIHNLIFDIWYFIYVPGSPQVKQSVGYRICQQ